MYTEKFLENGWIAVGRVLTELLRALVVPDSELLSVDLEPPGADHLVGIVLDVWTESKNLGDGPNVDVVEGAGAALAWLVDWSDLHLISSQIHDCRRTKDGRGADL